MTYGLPDISNSIRLREESLGFPFKEVFVHAKEDVVDKDKEISAREVVVMVSNDG